MEELPQFRPIPDTPARKDSFSSHQPVAHALARLIRNETERGKLIGLSGPWGSGKSTIIELLRAELCSNNDSLLFVWDAWAHQGDPLRRAFIDSISDFLGREGWIDRAVWKDELDLLSGRKVRIETVTEKRLTFWGSAVAILLIFCIPLGLALMGKYSSKWPEERDLRKFLQWGIALFLTPLSVAVLAWIWQRPKTAPWTKAFWITNRSGENTFLRLLVKEPKETVTSTSSKTLDPTSGEFRRVFVKMLKEALRYGDRRLVVIIDNLDRLDPEHAVDVWSTLRVFFEHDQQEDPFWIARFWLLVPYDREALKRLWKGSGDDDQYEAALLVDAFVDKTFQMVFDVAPPVVLSRAKYFRELYDAAFPGADAQKYGDTIYRLYDRLGPNSPSPRQIKLFLNKLGAFYLQGRSGLQLPLLALYRLKEGEISGDAKELRKADFLESRTLSLLGEEDWRRNWQKYLAAAHFNVPPEEALQVLKGDAIAEALESGEPAKVAPLIEEDGFWLICDRVIWERSPLWKLDGRLLTNATRSLAGFLSAAAAETSGKTWDAFEGIAREVESWGSIDEGVALGVELLVSRMRREKRDYCRAVCEKVVQSAASLPTAKTPLKEDLQAIAAWHKGASTVLRVLNEDETTRDLCDRIQGTLPAPDWVNLRFGLFLEKADIGFQDRFACSESGKVPNSIAQSMAATNYAPEFVQFAASLKTANPTLAWEELNSLLSAAFKDATLPEAFQRVLYAAVQVDRTATICDAIAVDAQVLLSKVTSAAEAKKWDAAGICFAGLFESDVESGNDVMSKLEPELRGSSDLHRGIVNALLEVDRCDLILRRVYPRLRELSQGALANIIQVQSSVIPNFADHADSGKRFGPASLALSYSRLRAIFERTPENLDALVTSWLTRPDVLPYLRQPASLRDLSPALYRDVLRLAEPPGKDHLLADLIKSLLGRAAKWPQAVRDADFEALLIEITRNAGAAWIPHSLALVLKEHFTEPPAAAAADVPAQPPSAVPAEHLTDFPQAGGASA